MSIPVFGLLNRHISGDDALLAYGKLRLEKIGIGAELHPGGVSHMQRELSFAPANKKCMLHIPYRVDILSSDGQRELLDFAKIFGGRCHGFVVHDSWQFADDLEAAINSLLAFNSKLKEIDSPTIFIEYAACIPFKSFLELAKAVAPLSHLGICIDIGHVAIEACRLDFLKKHPDIDVRDLCPEMAGLTELLPDVLESVAVARKYVAEFTGKISSFKSKIHFHLHDAHPLSTFSPYTICDHLPFFWRIPLPHEINGQSSLPCIFGFGGLKEVVAKARSGDNDELLSFTLEIHPQPGRRPLGEHDRFFQHWNHKGNAEQMAYWMDIIAHNYTLLEEILKDNEK